LPGRLDSHLKKISFLTKNNIIKNILQKSLELFIDKEQLIYSFNLLHKKYELKKTFTDVEEKHKRNQEKP
jgi:hypothetical protein